MDFTFTADEQAFAAEVRRFLRDHPPSAFPADGMDAGYGSCANSKALILALADQGWIRMAWPRAIGDDELQMSFKLVLMEESARAGARFGPLPCIWQIVDAFI